MLSSKNAKRVAQWIALRFLHWLNYLYFLKILYFNSLKKVLISSKNFKCKTSIACL